MVENKNTDQLVRRVKMLESIIKEMKASETNSKRDAFIEEFAYVATHDLKSPLANMEGYLDLLELDIQNQNEDVRNSLVWLRKCVLEAQNVIVDLTNSLKAVTHNDDHKVVINLNEMFENILAGLRTIIKKRDIIIITDITRVSEILYYPVALRSILQNLLSNACNYYDPTKDFKEIHITSSIDNDWMQIAIQDNGIGMDLSEGSESIFQLFNRKSDNEEGSGIGLYIVKKLLENYGGKITVESQPQLGSKFTIFIPIE